MGNLAAGHGRSYDSGMSYKALLFCSDDKTARVVTQVLTELDFQPEPCNEVFVAVKKLTSEHFDVIVVDCDDEQNAGLLFKSALHSGSNQHSLAVALAEDQSKVAAALRLGANLVLTKPISLEQSRSTLRVGRGLLRKNEGAKPSPTLPSTTTGAQHITAQEADPVAIKAVSGTLPPPVLSTVSAPAASILEVEKEPEPTLEPGEAALLESMPDPFSRKKSSPEIAAPKGSGWPAPVRPAESKVSAWPQTPATAKPATGSSDIISSPPAAAATPTKRSTVSSSSAGVGAGAAAAPARAKAPVVIEQAENIAIEPPTFSSLGMESGTERLGVTGNRKFLWIAVAVLAIAVAGYAGWTKLHSAPSGSELPGPPIASRSATAAQPNTSLQQPSAATASDTNGSPSQAPGTASHVEQAPDITLSSEVPPPPKSKAVRTPTAPLPAKSAPAAEAQPVLVVTNAAPQRPPQPAPAEEPDASAPPPSVIASNSGDQTISGIMASSTASTVTPAHSIQLSQGVAQGLLIKQVQPTYTAEAHRLRLQGAVELLATISTSGSITNLKQLSGDRILGRAALDAVKQWKYKPYLLDGQPVEVQTQITVKFNMQ